MSSESIPVWARTMGQHGEEEQWDTGVVRYPGSESTGPPPPDTRNDQRPSRMMLLIGLAMVLTALVIGAGLFFTFTGQDSGVAACQAIAEGKAADGSAVTAGATMSEAEYRKVRAVFADSVHPGIRDNGTKVIDLAWQIQQNPDAALLVASDLTRAYTGLAGACAEQGYVIPALGAR